jgi:hypothetical protein
MAEHLAVVQRVAGSNPVLPPTPKKGVKPIHQVWVLFLLLKFFILLAVSLLYQFLVRI